MKLGFKFSTIILLIFFPVFCALVSLCVGRLNISVSEVFNSILARFSLTEKSSALVESAVWNIRFPRILLSALVGLGLSVSGLVFQSLFSNPLATPDTLGIASGTSFGAILGIICGLSVFFTQLLAFFTGILALVLTYLGSRVGKGNNVSLILSGIMIGALFNALLSLLRFLADTETQLPSITYFLMGSLDGRGYSSLLFGAPIILICSLFIFLLRWRLNVMVLNTEEIISLGINVKLLRAVFILLATVIVSTAVSMCGQVGWVGLLVPHACRLIFGNNYIKLVPASLSIGSSFLIITDTLARSMYASEIPISILTAIIGAPFFIFLMVKNKGIFS